MISEIINFVEEQTEKNKEILRGLFWVLIVGLAIIGPFVLHFSKAGTATVLAVLILFAYVEFLMVEVRGIKEYSRKEKEKRENLQENLEMSLKRTIGKEVADLLEGPIPIRTHEEKYKKASKMINRTKKRLYLIQETPTVLLGCRKYNKDTDDPDEKPFWKALRFWLKSASKDELKRGFCAYPIEPTKNKIEEYDLENRVGKNLEDHVSNLEESHFYITSIGDKDYTGPLLVTDDEVELFVTKGLCLYQKDRKLANEIANLLDEKIDKRKDVEDLKSELGIDGK